MTENSGNRTLDELDRIILQELQHNSRISNVELARQVSLSPPAVHARVRRLEQLGYISRYTALLDWEQLGYTMLCFIHVQLQIHQLEQVNGFRDLVASMPEVLECHHVTGEHDYLLKVAIRDRKDLERFLMDKLTPIQAVARIHTSIVLREIKSTTILPLES
jgi:Lrp/AsnC family transcriptional regulator, leucine-responsive regulatory protein